MFTSKPALDSLRILADYPQWREERWIPVAGDGCGNYYLLVPEPGRSCSVCFIDTISSPSELAYLAASDLWHFLTFLLQAEPEATGWPFNEEFVCGADPEIVACNAAVLPWQI